MINDPGGWVYHVRSGGTGVLHFRSRGRPRVSTARLRGRNQIALYRSGAATNCLCVLCAFAVIISVSPVNSVATPLVYGSAPQSVNFFANYEEFPAWHTALLADAYRRQSWRLCDFWLRLRRAGDNFVPWIPLNDAFAVITSVYSVITVISVATPVVYNSAQSVKSVDRLVLPVPTPKIRRLRSELLSNVVDCLNQAADFLTSFWNLIPANTPQLIPIRHPRTRTAKGNITRERSGCTASLYAVHNF